MANFLWEISIGIILGGWKGGPHEDFQIFFWNGPKRTTKRISIPNFIKIGQRESVQIEGRKNVEDEDDEDERIFEAILVIF